MTQSNDIAKQGFVPQPLFVTAKGEFNQPNSSEALYKWYNYFKAGNTNTHLLFTGPNETEVTLSFKKDMEFFPSVLMDEMNSNNFQYDRANYTHLLQALLTNISDAVFDKSEEHLELCQLLENNIQFLQNFYYEYFNTESRLTMYAFSQFTECYQLKIDYWKIKLPGSSLLLVFEDCFAKKLEATEDVLTYKKLSYLKNLLQQVETATIVLSENYIRDLLIYYNFNSTYFIEYETEKLKEKIIDCTSNAEMTANLQTEFARIENVKTKLGCSYHASEHSVKRQLQDWVIAEIKKMELQDRKAADKDLQIDAESKIQTSLSVAKLAVLIRLLVADKIIINKSVAPMLRTVARLFTTLQKDEISFGSLETKYHAPDKNTINIIKEMLQKWVALTGKL